MARPSVISSIRVRVRRLDGVDRALRDVPQSPELADAQVQLQHLAAAGVQLHQQRARADLAAVRMAAVAPDDRGALEMPDGLRGRRRRRRRRQARRR